MLLQVNLSIIIL